MGKVFIGSKLGIFWGKSGHGEPISGEMGGFLSRLAGEGKQMGNLAVAQELQIHNYL